MTHEIILNWLQNLRSDVTIYPDAFFELRTQEEMIRADENKSFFVYVEIKFDKIESTFSDETAEKAFWENFLKCIAFKDRGSDVLGFLPERAGLGLLMLDSKMSGWTRLKGRIEEFCRRSLGDVSEILDTKVRAFVYPACLDDFSEIHKTTAQV
ncbi:MAG: hypothetical protein LBR60_03645 [Fibrobacter sp.]|jgi:hypothetical protein|nr:hypothetical protein [Fibrobacter sp.]